MLLNGVPFIVENTLKILIDENIITSFQLKGGKDFTHVILRFGMTSGETDKTENKYNRCMSVSTCLLHILNTFLTSDNPMYLC